MSENTVEKTSIKDALGEAYDELSVDDSVEAVDEDVEESAADEVIIIKADDDSEADATDNSQRDEQKEEVEEDSEGVAADGASDEEDDEVEPLAHWLRKDKEMFKGLPREAKEFLIDRDKEWQRKSEAKVQESLNIRRALEPLKDEMAQYGLSDDQAVRTLVGAHLMLKKNPKHGILQLMSQYQLSPEALFSEEESAPQVDPRVAALEDKVYGYEQLMTAREQAALAARIDEFRKTAEFFDDVTPEMTQLALAERQRNPNAIPDIAVLYDKACWMNVDVREKLMRVKRNEAEKVELTERSRAAAGARVRPTAASKKRPGETRPATMRDELAAVWDDVEQREKTGTAL